MDKISQSRRTATPNLDAPIFTLWGRVRTNEDLTLERISGHWDLDYDTLDLILQPGYFCYKYFAIQPEFGIRGAWIDWDYIIQQNFLSSGDIRNQRISNSNDFHAIGFLAGTNMKWFMGCGFHIYANALTSILYGQFDIDQPTRLIADPDFNLNQPYNEKYWRVRSNLHLALGLEWERFFMNNSMRLNLHAGYEFLVWFNQNQLHRFRNEIFDNNPVIGEIEPIIERDDLGLNGLTVGARLEF